LRFQNIFVGNDQIAAADLPLLKEFFETAAVGNISLDEKTHVIASLFINIAEIDGPQQKVLIKKALSFFDKLRVSDAFPVLLFIDRKFDSYTSEKAKNTCAQSLPSRFIGYTNNANL
jgi:hypothetical protein